MSPFRHVEVPYFSQWASPDWVRPIVEEGADPCDDPMWAVAGFEAPDEYRFWSWKTCGLACLESVLSHWGFEVPSRADLVRSALTWGAYRKVGPNRAEGLTYGPFAEWVGSEFGLEAEVHRQLPLDEIADQVDERSVV